MHAHAIYFQRKSLICQTSCISGVTNIYFTVDKMVAFIIHPWLRTGQTVVIAWWLDLQLTVQSVFITTKIGSSNLTHGEVYSIQHYM